MKTKLVTLAFVVLFAWELKHHYSVARADELWWILTPTARAVGVVTGTTFAATSGEGYVSRERLFVIEKSCAGINFMIAAFVMVALAMRHRVTSTMAGIRTIALALSASYAAALVVNTTRITIAMWLAAHPWRASLSAVEVHRLEGIAVYFGGLVLLYEIVLRIDRGDAKASIGS